MTARKYNGVSAVELSENAKIGRVSATYVSQNSCPKTCPFMGSGCYAENGNVGFQTARLNRDAEGMKALQLARHEAKAIDGLSRLPLRLHVVGDATTDRCAKIVSGAADAYRLKHGSDVWTYTHAWRQVARASWQGVSVLASCETVAAARKAQAKGYGTAIVVTEHQQETAYVVDGQKLIPCPQQTGRAQNCEACKLCFKADRLRDMNASIAFATHGATKKANQALVEIQGVS